MIMNRSYHQTFVISFLSAKCYKLCEKTSKEEFLDLFGSTNDKFSTSKCCSYTFMNCDNK